jgi:hypothetical protein
MASTSNSYTGNGSNKLFSITFPYLETTDIFVFVNGSFTTAYAFANATTIQFTTAPANGAAVYIARNTNDTALQATFFPGSSIKAADLNLDFDQVLYISQEATNEAQAATFSSNAATTTANVALSQSSAAVNTANTASTNASAAVTTANTASTNASAAVSTANTASSNASTAVTTANSAVTTANTKGDAAIASAASANTTAASAVTTANAATTSANNAVSIANTKGDAAIASAATAVTTSNNAVSIANTKGDAAIASAATANTNASTALTAANNAVTTSNNATSFGVAANANALEAVAISNAAATAVANAVLYDTIANVAAIPASPSNGDAVEVIDSAGIESFSPLAGLPSGFVGSSALSVRIIYITTGTTWSWIQYYPNDPESRYLAKIGGTMTGPLLGDNSTSTSTPAFAFDGDANTGVGRTGTDELALITGGVARLTADAAGNINVPGGLSQGSNSVVTTGDTGTVTSAMIADGAIVNADISATAGIANSKFAVSGVTAGTYGSSTQIPQLTINDKGVITVASTTSLPAGIVTTSDTGTVTSLMIADGTIVSNDISSSAGIAHSKLASILAGQLLVGNASNVPTATALSGDATLSSSGAVTLANSGVTAGTYRSLTVDAKGRATAGTNPTTFSGYGFSDTSAGLAAAISDETGTGSLVFADSPNLAGSPTTPTATAGTNTTQIASTAFVSTALASAGFPSGTAMLFVQTTAPTGWTKSTTHDNKALRVVSGTAGSGGSTAFTSVFASRTPSGTVGATTLTEAQIPSHTHSYSSALNTRLVGGAAGPTAYQITGNTTGATGGGGSHDHSFTGNPMDFAVQYVDVIIATKN